MLALNERGVTVKECDVADAIQNIRCVVVTKERINTGMDWYKDILNDYVFV